MLSLIAIVITLTCEIWTRFLKNIHQKWEYYKEEKQDFERLLIFVIKMSTKSNKIELSEGQWGVYERRTDPLGYHVPILSRQNWKRKKSENNVR